MRVPHPLCGLPVLRCCLPNLIAVSSVKSQATCGCGCCANTAQNSPFLTGLLLQAGKRFNVFQRPQTFSTNLTIKLTSKSYSETDEQKPGTRLFDCRSASRRSRTSCSSRGPWIGSRWSTGRQPRCISSRVPGSRPVKGSLGRSLVRRGPKPRRKGPATSTTST